MALVIPQTNLPDDFQDFTLGANLIGGNIQITENPAEIEIIYGGFGLVRDQESITVPVGSYTVGRSPSGIPLAGIRAKNATPGVVAVLGGYFWTESDPTLSFIGVPSGAGAGVNSARVWRSSNQAILAGAANVISFDTEIFDNGDMWVVGQPTRLTIPSGGDGKYLVGAHCHLGASATDEFQGQIRLNGVTVIGLGWVNSAAGPTVGASTLWDGVAGDYFEFIVQGVAALNRTVLSAGDYSPIFYATRLP